MCVGVDEAWQDNTVGAVYHLCVLKDKISQDVIGLVYCNNRVFLYYDGAVDDDPPTGVQGENGSMAVNGRVGVHLEILAVLCDMIDPIRTREISFIINAKEIQQHVIH
jgi:hypothetical protein